MALTTKYYGLVYGEQEGNARVNIITDFAGIAQEIKLNALSINYEGDGTDLYELQLQGSSCEVGIEIDRGVVLDAAVESWFSGLVGSESSVYIEVLRNGNREWIGKCLLDLVTIGDAPFYTIDLTATCGLGLLGDYDFDYALDSETPNELILGDVLMKALLPCYTDQFFDSSTTYIRSTLNTYASEAFSYKDTKCPLEVHKIGKSVLIKDTEKNEPLTCKEVIEYILAPFRARIRMHNGAWQLIVPDQYSQSSFRYFNYSNQVYTSGPISTTTVDPLISEGTNLITEAGNNFTYKPALIRVDVLFNPISSVAFNKDYNSTAYYPSVEVSNLNTLPVRLTGSVTYEVPRIFNGTTNAINGTVRMFFITKAKAGSTVKYRLAFTQANGFYWSTDPNAVVYYDFPNPSDGRNVNTQDITLNMPTLQDTSIDNLGFEIYCVNQTPTCGQAIDFSTTLSLAQQFTNDTYKDDILYRADNSLLTDNSKYTQKEIYIGDSLNKLCSGAIKAREYGTSDFVNSSVWKVTYASTIELPIGQTLAKYTMAMARNSVLVYQGAFIFKNAYSAFNSISYDNKYFFFNSVILLFTICFNFSQLLLVFIDVLAFRRI